MLEVLLNPNQSVFQNTATNSQWCMVQVVHDNYNCDPWW